MKESSSPIVWLKSFFPLLLRSVCLAQMCVDVLPAVCGKSWRPGPMVWAGLDWRILPAACEIITHLISQDLPINGQSDALSQPFKRSRVKPPAVVWQRLKRGGLSFMSSFTSLDFHNESILFYSDVFCVCVPHALFYICRRMSSTVLSAVILLACALAFSAAQSECNLCGFCTA